MLNTSILDYFGPLPDASDRLNTLKLVDDVGGDISALAFIVALRNAVAHGDGRNVKPVNRPNQLVGFEFSLSRPKNFPSWSSETQLNRSIMAQIAGKIAEVFYQKFQDQLQTQESDINSIEENE